jgi:hypothetical protein
MGFNSGFKGLKSANGYSSHKTDYVGGYNINIIFHIYSSLFGPVNIDNVWSIRNNMEIDNRRCRYSGIH